jgi:hypothetical protein
VSGCASSLSRGLEFETNYWLVRCWWWESTCGCSHLFWLSDIRHIARCRLYTVYMVVVIFLFYIVLFRHTIRRATREVDKARNFVMRMPLYILDQDRLDIFLTFFQSGDDDNDDDDDEVVSPEGAGARVGDPLAVDKALPRSGSDDSVETENPLVCSHVQDPAFATMLSIFLVLQRIFVLR